MVAAFMYASVIGDEDYSPAWKIIHRMLQSAYK